MSTDRENVRVAVVGAGHIAQKHLEVLTDLPNVEICALVDANAQALQETADRFGIETRLTSYQALLEGDRPDAAFVLVSVLAIADVAADFIKAGVPTFLEKPPGIHTSQTRRLAELAKESGVTAMVGVNRRFYSNAIRGREMLIEAGPIQTVTLEAHEDLARIWARPKFPPEVVQRWGVANGIHALDMLRFFGGDVANVVAVQRAFESPMPNACAAILEFEAGALGRAAMDWTGPGGHRFEVRTSGATLTSNSGYSQLTLRRCGQDDLTLGYDELDTQYKPGFFRQNRAFIHSVRTGEPLPFPACDLEDAVKTMEMIDAIAGTA